MTVDEMELIGRFRDVEPLPAEVAERAELVLRAAIALNDDQDCGSELPGECTRRPMGRRNPRGRRALAALGGIAAATALVVAATTIFTGNRHAPAPGPTVSLPSAQTGIQTVSYLVDRVSAALEATAGSISYNQARTFGAKGVFLGTSESWIAPKVAAYRSEDLNAAGTPVSGMVVTLTPPGNPAVYIDYSHHVWTAREQPPTGVGLGFGGLSTTVPSGGDTASAASAALHTAEVLGELKLDGTGTYNGRTVIRLQEQPRQGQPDTLRGGSNTIWLDASTYLPVHEVITEPRDPQTGAETNEIDFQWLPATAANLQLITAEGAIPTGFSQVPGDRYPGELPSFGPPKH